MVWRACIQGYTMTFQQYICMLFSLPLALTTPSSTPHFHPKVFLVSLPKLTTTPPSPTMCSNPVHMATYVHSVLKHMKLRSLNQSPQARRVLATINMLCSLLHDALMKQFYGSSGSSNCCDAPILHRCHGHETDIKCNGGKGPQKACSLQKKQEQQLLLLLKRTSTAETRTKNETL